MVSHGDAVNRYIYPTFKRPPTACGFEVGDKVRPNMNHPKIGDIKSRASLRGVIKKIGEKDILVKWANTYGDAVAWERDWLLHE
jgi:hypothetical protein